MLHEYDKDRAVWYLQIKNKITCLEKYNVWNHFLNNGRS